VWETWGSGDLIRIDPHRERAERIDLHTNLYGVAVGEGSVWVGDQLHGTIIPVDPASGAPGKPIDLFGNIDAIAVGEGQVWVLDKGAGTVTPIDPSQGRPQPQVGVGDNPTDMEVGLGAVWVSDESGTIARIDALTHQKTSFDLDVPVASLAVDTESETLWVLVAERVQPF
jgi:streptogramin lyase